MCSAWLCAAILQAQTGGIEQRFAEARRKPGELYAFLLRMPKGGDLHNHLSGAVYAESYLRAGAEDGLCVDLKNYSMVAPPCGENGVPAARTQSDNALANALIDSLSMRNFVPGRESAHDHFFGTFAKFGPIRAVHRGEFVAEVVRRAAEQNESYLELMAINGGPANALGERVGFDGDFAATKDKLVSGLAAVVQQMRERVDAMDQGRRAALGCSTQPSTPPCRLVVRYLYEVLRESPKEQVFAQVLAGLMLCSADSRMVGINFVQPEDGRRSMRDYHWQMQMLDYAQRLYPNVHVTLHAGEIAPGLVPPDGLRFHIREAIELGHAERIGHGVSVMYETDALGLLGLMKARRILVEINLTSNDLILGVRGPEHPFPVYRKYGVPVALSTDDEGVSRGHLTEEYRRAVLTYGLRYSDLKELVRNSLEYSFLPGASYWQDRAYRAPVAACAGGAGTKACQTFLNSSEKARMEADLEDRFRAFER
jgi:adenosine deaminase